MLIQEICKIKICHQRKFKLWTTLHDATGLLRTSLVTSDLKVTLLDNGQHCIINQNTAVYCCNLLPISLKKMRLVVHWFTWTQHNTRNNLINTALQRLSDISYSQCKHNIQKTDFQIQQ